MTLRVTIKNEGNQPTDTFVMRNVEIVGGIPESEDAPVQIRAGGTDTICLAVGQEAILYPPCEHYADFIDIPVKGYH